MGRNIRSNRRISGGKPSKRPRSDGSIDKLKIRKSLIVDTTTNKRRRIDSGNPYEIAKLTRNYSAGGYHVYRTDELNALLDKQLEQDLKDVKADIGEHPGIVAIKSGWKFLSHVSPQLDMSVPGKLTELVGITVASAGSSMIKLSLNKLRDMRQASGSAAASVEPPEIKFVREKLKKGMDFVSLGFDYISSNTPTNLITMTPIEQSRIKDHNTSWEEFKKNMSLFLGPIVLSDEEKEERLEQLEDMVEQFNRRYGETPGPREGHSEKYEIWSNLISEINTIKVDLKIPLHKISRRNDGTAELTGNAVDTGRTLDQWTELLSRSRPLHKISKGKLKKSTKKKKKSTKKKKKSTKKKKK